MISDKRYISPSTTIKNGNDEYSIPQIAELIEQRQKFRAKQDWENADRIRLQLEKMGFVSFFCLFLLIHFF